MTVKDIVRTEIDGLFAVDESAVDAQADHILQTALPVIDFIQKLRTDLDRLFGEDGATYVGEVVAAFSQLSSTGASVPSLFPRSANLRYALEVANAITGDQMEEQVPVGYDAFRLDEDTSFDGVYDAAGEKLPAFFYQNAGNFSDSVSYLDLTDAAVGLTSANFDHSPELNVVVILLLARTEHVVGGRRWIVSCSAEPEKREYLLKFHILLRGNVLTRPIYSPAYSGITGIGETLTCSVGYEQFKEPFEMLSEINSRKTVIDSYLSAYHTLENYMVRARIVEVESNHNGSTFFSIRHFKRMGIALGDGESQQLQYLFEDCWDLTIGGTTFSSFVTDQVTHLITAVGGFQSPDLTSFLQKLGATADFSVANQNNKRTAVAKLIYQIRCSIVHNKETEYHISNRELRNQTNRLVLTDLCIPIMHRLAFGLPSVPLENPIRYSRKSIDLY